LAARGLSRLWNAEPPACGGSNSRPRTLQRATCLTRKQKRCNVRCYRLFSHCLLHLPGTKRFVYPELYWRNVIVTHLGLYVLLYSKL
jgi:hypothetical protein